MWCEHGPVDVPGGQHPGDAQLPRLERDQAPLPLQVPEQRVVDIRPPLPLEDASHITSVVSLGDVDVVLEEIAEAVGARDRLGGERIEGVPLGADGRYHTRGSLHTRAFAESSVWPAGVGSFVFDSDIRAYGSSVTVPSITGWARALMMA